MKEVLEAYQALAIQKGKDRMPSMQPGGVWVDSLTVEQQDVVWQELTKRQPMQGWLLFQSQQMAFHQGLPKLRDEWGFLLGCEAVAESGDSIAILQDGQGGWCILDYRHHAEAEGLWDEVRQYAHDPATGRLCYRRYWEDAPGQGFVQQHACFIGFE